MMSRRSSSLAAGWAMPDWAVPFFSQFPIVGAICVGVAIAARYLDRRNGEYLDRLEHVSRENRESLDQAVARYDAAIAHNTARHEAELERLRQSHDAHLRTLRAEIR